PPAATRRPWWARLLGRVLAPWISLTVEPARPLDYAPTLGDQPVCYVIEHYGLSNALILEQACRASGLPSPLQPLPGDPLGRKRAYVALSRRNANALGPLQHSLGTHQPTSKSHSTSLARLLDAHRQDPWLDVQLVPVS